MERVPALDRALNALDGVLSSDRESIVTMGWWKAGSYYRSKNQISARRMSHVAFGTEPNKETKKKQLHQDGSGELREAMDDVSPNQCWRKRKEKKYLGPQIADALATWAAGLSPH